MAAPAEKQVIKVYDKEGVYRALAVERTTTAKDVVVMFVKKLRSQESADVFRLFIEFPDGSRKKCTDEDTPYKYIMEHPEFCKSRNMNPADKPLKFTILQNVEEPPPPANGREASKSSATAPAPITEEVAGYLKKKKKGPVKAFFETYWVVYREAPRKNLELYESEEQSQSVVVYALENASFELQASEGELYMVVTLSNSEKHIFHSDEDGVIQQWMEALNPVNTLASPLANVNSSAAPAGPAGVAKPGAPFVPTSKDLAHLSMKKKPQGPKENVDMQIKVLIHWLEYLLTKQDLSVTNLEKDLRDGIVLATVIDILFGKKVKVKQPKSVFDYSENITSILDALSQLGVTTGKVTATEIAENSSNRLLLPVLWSMFYKFVDVDKDALLAWGKNYAATRGLNLNGYQSLQDGFALAAIISEFKTELIDYDALTKGEPLAAITTVMEVANKNLGFPKLFEPSDAEQADEKIWSLYLSFFYLALDQSHHEKWVAFQERRDTVLKPTPAAKPVVTPSKPPAAFVPVAAPNATATPTAAPAANGATPAAPTAGAAKGDKPIRPVSVGPKKAAGVQTPTSAPAKPRPVSTKAAPVPSDKAAPAPAEKAAPPPAEKAAPPPAEKAAPAPAEKAPAPPATEESSSTSTTTSTPSSPTSTSTPTTEAAASTAAAPPPTTTATPASPPTPTPEPTPTPATAPASTPAAPAEPVEQEVPRPPETSTPENVVLDEKFVGGVIDNRLLWYNPPQNWGLAETGLLVCPDKGTDFWRKTHYGFERDNGHYLYMPASGNFTATTRITWKGIHQYDQAGLMIRLNESCWLKTSVEYILDSPPKLGVVVTNYGFSDWSTQSWTQPSSITLRIRRVGADYFVEYWSTKAPGSWVQMRIAHLFDDDGTSDVLCGVYACTPTDAGYEAMFEYLKIESNPAPEESK